MASWKDGVFLVSMTLMAWVSMVHSQPPNTCVAGVYYSGQRARVTCYFYEEINTRTNEGVAIFLRNLHSPKTSSGKEVLKCSFAGDTVSVCETEDNFSFISFHKNNLTMEISPVSAEFQGSYECRIIPAGGKRAEKESHTCILLVDGIQSACPPPEVKCVSGCSAVYVNLVLLLILLTGSVLLFLFLNQKKQWFTLPFSKTVTARNSGEDVEEGCPEHQPLNQAPDTEDPVDSPRSQPSSPSHGSAASDSRQQDTQRQGPADISSGADTQPRIRNPSGNAGGISGRCALQ